MHSSIKIILSQLGWLTFLKGIDTRVSTVEIEDQSGCMAGDNDIPGIVMQLLLQSFQDCNALRMGPSFHEGDQMHIINGFISLLHEIDRFE